MPVFALFTDFGLDGPYVGQVKAKIWEQLPASAIIDLIAHAPDRNPRAAAYLLAALAPYLPLETVFLGVVDPGVGGDRPGVALRAMDRWFVGPENGLFEIVRRRVPEFSQFELPEGPPEAAPTFHGRDIFAPAAVAIARDGRPPGVPRPADWGRRPDWPDDLPEIIYIDRYGNAVTGLRETVLRPTFALKVGKDYIQSARTFSDVPTGSAFWYVNSNGLVEIAVNQGNASEVLSLKIGTAIAVSE